jgi:cbb3-type cytochrome oxidase subunit 3
MTFVLSFIVALHLIGGSLAAAGSCIAALGEWYATHKQLAMMKVVMQRLAVCSLLGLAISIAAGLLLWAGSSAWYQSPDRLEYATRLQALWTNQPWWGFWAELGFTAFCLLFAVWGQYKQWSAGWIRGLLLAGGTNLAYHLPMRMLILRVLSEETAYQTVEWSRELKYEILQRADFWARITHHWLAMIIVSCAAIYWLYLRSTRNNADSATQLTGLNWTARLNLLAIILQMMCGCWLLLVSSEPVQATYLGENLVAAAWMFSGIGLGIITVPILFVIAFGDEKNQSSLRQMLGCLAGLNTLALIAMCLATQLRRGL